MPREAVTLPELLRARPRVVLSPDAPPAPAAAPLPPALEAFRCDIVSAQQLAALLAAPLPLGLASDAPRRAPHRDVYLDTADDALRRRGIVCRLRLGADDRRQLSLRLVEAGAVAQRWDAPVRSADAREALLESTSPGRRLRALVDPALLVPRVELEVDRWVRAAQPDWLRRPRLALHYDRVTARAEGAVREFWQLSVRRLRGGGDEVRRLAAALREAHGLHVVLSHPRDHAELFLRWARGDEAAAAGLRANRLHRVPRPSRAVAAEETSRFLDPDLSHLAFQERVLALAEDPRTPLRARLRFLAIVSANVDEFFMVRVAGIREAAADASELAEEPVVDGRTPAERLDAIDARVRALSARQARCFAECVAALRPLGVRLSRWDELGAEARAALRARFEEEILPALTPFAMTLSPGHPLPHLPHLSLSLAVVLPPDADGRPHFAELELPDALPRFLRAGEQVVPLEEVVRGNLDALYPASAGAHGDVGRAHLFRVTRGGGLGLDDARVDDLLEAVAQATRRRPHNLAVRLEVEAGMPLILRDLVLANLRRERIGDGPALERDDIHEVHGFVDLRRLEDLDVPDVPGIDFPRVRGRDPLPAGAPSFLDAVRAGDLLVHHPFDGFGETVARFLREAADDPDVAAIKITLYRLGDASPVASALLAAARRGVEVTAFVELKARFDEERNVRWARELAEAGGRLVYGLEGLKTHAKMSLVVRREGGALRRYVHVGTGNYNARTARLYTDLSLFSAAEPLAADVAALFNALTGSARAPHPLANGALVAPTQLLPALLERIERERAHALAGRGGRIRCKLNGLSDTDVVEALYRASQAGVAIDLVVRGICTLRPGVAGLSERIRVVSVVGPLLEHSRIFHFANGGADEYLIGSADLRPRNLRRRVELLVPVRDPACRAVLDSLLTAYTDDPTGWALGAGGDYAQRAQAGEGVHERLLRGG